MFPECKVKSKGVADQDSPIQSFQLNIHHARPGTLEASLKIEPYNGTHFVYITPDSYVYL